MGAGWKRITNPKISKAKVVVVKEIMVFKCGLKFKKLRPSCYFRTRVSIFLIMTYSLLRARRVAVGPIGRKKYFNCSPKCLFIVELLHIYPYYKSKIFKVHNLS